MRSRERPSVGGGALLAALASCGWAAISERPLLIAAPTRATGLAAARAGSHPLSQVGVAPVALKKVFGPLKDRLLAEDIQRLVTAAGGANRTVWWIETYAPGPAATAWYVDAYLSPFDVTDSARRGLVVQLEGEVIHGRGVRSWRAIERRRQWVQVPLPGRPYNNTPDGADLDGAIHVLGAFTMAQLLNIVDVLRSGPQVVTTGTVGHPLAKPVPSGVDREMRIEMIERMPSSHTVAYLRHPARPETSLKAVMEVVNSRWVVAGFLP